MKVDGWIIEDITQEDSSGRSVVVSVIKRNPVTFDFSLWFETYFFESEKDFEFYQSLWENISKHPIIYKFLVCYAKVKYSGDNFREAMSKRV